VYFLVKIVENNHTGKMSEHKISMKQTKFCKILGLSTTNYVLNNPEMFLYINQAKKLRWSEEFLPLIIIV